MNKTALFLVSLLGTVFAVRGVANAQATKPNIVIIWGDDVGRSNIRDDLPTLPAP